MLRGFAEYFDFDYLELCSGAVPMLLIIETMSRGFAAPVSGLFQTITKGELINSMSLINEVVACRVICPFGNELLLFLFINSLLIYIYIYTSMESIHKFDAGT